MKSIERCTFQVPFGKERSYAIDSDYSYFVFENKGHLSFPVSTISRNHISFFFYFHVFCTDGEKVRDFH